MTNDIPNFMEFKVKPNDFIGVDSLSTAYYTTVYHLPTCNSIAGLGSLILILILSHIFEASTVEVSVNGSNICEWIKYL